MAYVEEPADQPLRRGTFLKLGAAGSAALAMGGAGQLVIPQLKKRGLFSANGVFDATSTALADVIYIEAFPTSPLILTPFTRSADDPAGAGAAAEERATRLAKPPGPGIGQQNSIGNEAHQMWPSGIGFPDPIVYKIDLQVATHSFTTSQVLPINGKGKPKVSFDASGKTYPAGTQRTLPPSTIYGFNGTFPGPRINAEYGKPVLVRFENHLDENPLNLDRQDFGSPDCSFLTHLHNGHTAPESDGNPHYCKLFGPKARATRASGVDNLYLNWPAGERRPGEAELLLVPRPPDGPHRRRTSTREWSGSTRSTTRRTALDIGDERQGLRLPGVRTNHADGSFDVDYDIPLALYDCRLDDGITTHKDIHDTDGESPPPATRGRTRSGGARRSTSTSRTTASSATSSPSTAPRTRCWR